MTETRLPVLAVVLSAAGLIPLLGCALIAVRADPVHGAVSALALISYGAVVLAFLGGVHWGFVLEGEEEPTVAERRRLVLGVVPGLIGWAAELMGNNAHPVIGIGLLIFGFIGTAVMEQRGQRNGLVPHGYMVLRWILTGITALVLAAVLVVRMVGGYLIF